MTDFSLVFITLLSLFYTLHGPKAADSYNLVEDCDKQFFVSRKNTPILATVRERILDRWMFGLSMFVLMFLWHLKLAVYPSKGTRNASPVC